MKVVHVFLLLLFFNSCAKSGQYSCFNSNTENLMLDTYWQIDTTFTINPTKGIQQFTMLLLTLIT